MKLISIISCFILAISMYGATTTTALVGKKKIKFTISEPDAKVWVNGIETPSENLLVIVPKEECITVLVKKVGFISEKIRFCNKKNAPDLPKSYFLELKVDDSFEASEMSQEINRDIKLDSKIIEKDQAWKTINQTLLNYVDVIELMDKETGYLYTEWDVKAFTQNTVRTRIIIKQTSSEPLVFKVKLVSEYSGQALTPVKSDIKFKEWDRVLKNYKAVVQELQDRLK